MSHQFVWGDSKIAVFPNRGDHKIKYLFDRGDRKISGVKFPRFFSPPPPVVNDVSLTTHIVVLTRQPKRQAFKILSGKLKVSSPFI